MKVLLHGTGKEINKVEAECGFPEALTIIGAVITDNAALHNKNIKIFENLYPELLKQKGLLLISNSASPADVNVLTLNMACQFFNFLINIESNKMKVSRENRTLLKIINSTHDGMIAINTKAEITLLNKQAENITGIKAADALGKPVKDVMPTSKLPRVLEREKIESNKKQTIGKDRTIVTTRVPMFEKEAIIGVLAVFQDITDIEKMAEEVTNLKSIRTMLEAIIFSSDDAISVVDEKGSGLLINPAYTRLTGLKNEMVIGKPAGTDISEGESIHMKVLETGLPVRGARMKVGPLKKEVIVNVAPVIVDNKIKGSVGVIHDISEMEQLTSELEQAKQIIRTLEAKYEFADIIGSSKEIAAAVAQSKAAAKTPVSILLRGESGTGKELFAHAIHNESSRKYNKFVRVNCAALAETLLESELFGHEEGAFSGAKRGGKKGLFEEADKGSLFLDEIGELSSQMQAKLLRALQEKEIVRVGGTTSISIDVRVIAATNIQLEKKIEEGEFRSDLYYRLNRLPIYIPALRERKGDINELVYHLLRKLNQDYGMNVHSISEEAILKLKRYEWPGNVRELENILGRAIIHIPKSIQMIQPADIILADKEIQKKEVKDDKFKESLEQQLQEREKEILSSTLIKTQGNKTLASKLLNISIRSLYYKLDKYNL